VPTLYLTEEYALVRRDSEDCLLVEIPEERLNEDINHPLFDYKVTYRRCIELQARILAKFVTGEIEEYAPFLIK
jgi:CRISPR-associated protein Cas1